MTVTQFSTIHFSFQSNSQGFSKSIQTSSRFGFLDFASQSRWLSQHRRGHTLKTGVFALPRPPASTGAHFSLASNDLVALSTSKNSLAVAVPVGDRKGSCCCQGVALPSVFWGLEGKEQAVLRELLSHRGAICGGGRR